MTLFVCACGAPARTVVPVSLCTACATRFYTALVRVGSALAELERATAVVDDRADVERTPLGWTVHVDHRVERTLTGRRRMTALTAVDIREASAAGVTQTKLARRYAMNRATISNIVYGRTWAAAGGPIKGARC